MSLTSNEAKAYKLLHRHSTSQLLRVLKTTQTNATEAQVSVNRALVTSQVPCLRLLFLIVNVGYLKKIERML